MDKNYNSIKSLFFNLDEVLFFGKTFKHLKDGFYFLPLVFVAFNGEPNGKEVKSATSLL